MKNSPLAAAWLLSVLVHAGGVYLMGELGKPDGKRSESGFSVTLRTGVRSDQTDAAPTLATHRQHASTQTAATDTRQEAADSDQAQLAEQEASDFFAPAPLALSDFLEGDQLTTLATPREHIDLSLADSSAMSAPGSMTLKLWIDEAGKVVQTEIERSDFPAVYSDAIVSIFRQAAFEPARVQQQAVKSILRIETRTE